jgi:intein-encoded DNA endonuclease-like protein
MSKLTEEQKDELFKRYETEDLSLVELGKIYNISDQTISKYAKKRNIKIKPRGQFNRIYSLNEYYLDVIDTEEKAYFLGLIYSDGFNNEELNYIEISLQESDKHILEALNKAFGSNKPLMFLDKKKQNPNWENCYRLTLNSRHLSEMLSSSGCVQAKSLILEFPKNDRIPKHLIRHFIRGYFDGDGTVGVYQQKKRKNYFTLSCGIIANLDFCLELNKQIEHLDIKFSIYHDKRTPDKPTRNAGIHANSGVIKFLDWLYQDTNLFIKRKYDTYISGKEKVLNRVTLIKRKK